jgi:threonine aldolase
MVEPISFSCDYLEGAHPSILQRLGETNLLKTPGYGLDRYSEAAKAKIRAACRASEADIFFLVGGTQTNAVVIDALLQSYQGVIAADSGHISVHEAGAIERSGHKILTLPHHTGKLSAAQIEALLSEYQNDANHDHMVMPGMVYLSHPTEYGTLYSLSELREISAVCRAHGLPLYLDGARLAYALACPQNDVTLPDLAALCDVFYLGGTKCGALFGEAVVIPKAGRIPHFFTIIKQHGALLAKGRLLGLQFDALFTDGLYGRIGQPAIQAAEQIRQTLTACGYTLCFGSPTNQVFCVVENHFRDALAQQVEFGFWERYDDEHTIIRFATSWATQQEDVTTLCRLLAEQSKQA